MRTLLAYFCFLAVAIADTNTVTHSALINDRIDNINTDMKQHYRLPVKADSSIILTGYTVQDIFTKLNKTYSVLRVEF
jgi:hypothetical protein